MEIIKKGLVLKSTGSRYQVLSDDNKLVECTFKGKFKISSIRSTNPIAVGDRVEFREDPESNISLITKILDRKNYIIRKASNLSKETHIIAANVDIAFLVITINKPSTQIGFVDRFLASAEAYRIPVHLIINKVDLLNEEELIEAESLIDIYESIGYPCHLISAFNEENINEIHGLIQGKVCLFAGNSGVGKSTLSNAIDPELKLKTSEISSYHSKGKHTTTFAQMYPLSNDSYIIDTPGIKGFGVFDMDKYEISHFFPEIFKESANCKFNNCLHFEEPKCAVIEAVEEGRISYSRYESYLKILLDENDKYRKPQ